MAKKYLNDLWNKKYDGKKNCEKCNKASSILFCPNELQVIDADGEATGDDYLICRTCLNDFFTLQNKRSK